MWQLSSGYQTKCFGKLCKIYRKRSGIRIPAECSDSISHPPHPSQLLAGVPPSCRSHCRQSQCSLSAAPGPAPCCRLLARRGTHHTRASSASGTPADTVCRTCAGTRTQWGEQPGGPRAFPVWYGAAFPCAARSPMGREGPVRPPSSPALLPRPLTRVRRAPERDSRTPQGTRGRWGVTAGPATARGNANYRPLRPPPPSSCCQPGSSSHATATPPQRWAPRGRSRARKRSGAGGCDLPLRGRAMRRPRPSAILTSRSGSTSHDRRRCLSSLYHLLPGCRCQLLPVAPTVGSSLVVLRGRALRLEEFAPPLVNPLWGCLLLGLCRGGVWGAPDPHPGHRLLTAERRRAVERSGAVRDRRGPRGAVPWPSAVGGGPAGLPRAGCQAGAAPALAEVWRRRSESAVGGSVLCGHPRCPCWGRFAAGGCQEEASCGLACAKFGLAWWAVPFSGGLCVCS